MAHASNAIINKLVFIFLEHTQQNKQQNYLKTFCFHCNEPGAYKLNDY